MRWRVEYEKGSVIRFLSHLDMVRLWERLLRRSGLPLQLTQGFNPHLKLSLGTVLPVGLWGRREYLDMELEEDCGTEDLQFRLQAAAPPGIEVRRLREIPAGRPSLMAEVNASLYRMAFPRNMEDRLRDGVSRMSKAPRILITSPKNRQEIDIRPGLWSLRYFAAGERLELEVLAPTGSREAVRYPDLLLALADFGLPREEMSDSWREANYIRSNGGLKDPLELS